MQLLYIPNSKIYMIMNWEISSYLTDCMVRILHAVENHKLKTQKENTLNILHITFPNRFTEYSLKYIFNSTSTLKGFDDSKLQLELPAFWTLTIV
jgi:hypothetical protein